MSIALAIKVYILKNVGEGDFFTTLLRFQHSLQDRFVAVDIP